MGHLVAFLIGSWNLVLIDAAREPGVSWSLLVVGAWAAALLIHAALHVATAIGEQEEGPLPGKHGTPTQATWRTSHPTP